MKIISILNQKGGTDKTTIAVNLGKALSLLKKKVLLIDFNPHGFQQSCKRRLERKRHQAEKSAIKKEY